MTDSFSWAIMEMFPVEGHMGCNSHIWDCLYFKKRKLGTYTAVQRKGPCH